MKQLTYREAYDKIINAYFKDEISPLDARFCFCGTLCGSDKWFGYTDEDLDKIRHRNHGSYKGVEYARMEHALLSQLPLYGNFNEDHLFAGMSAALDVLKEIHRERGENVDEAPTLFKKRELVVK